MQKDTSHEGAADELSDFDDMMRRAAAPADGPSPEEIARRRRRRRRGGIVALTIIALVLASIGGYTGWTLTRPLPTPVAAVEPPGVPVGPATAPMMPERGAAAVSVAGVEHYLGPDAAGIWQVSGSEDQRPIASLSKLVTTLVILDRHPLAGPEDPGPTIWFTEADYRLYDEYYVLGATIAALPRGSSMTLRDALATMLIPSASNYAEAVSTWAFGSQGAFVEATRRWLADRGLTSTVIVEPTGISERNISTPRDLMSIAQLAAADPTISQISATRSLSLDGPGRMSNTNTLLGDHGVDGLKTGNLGPGSHHLMFTATVVIGPGESARITGVVLDGETRDTVAQDVVELISSIQSGFHEVSLIERGHELGTYTTPWGSTATLVVSDDASILTWSDTPIALEMDLNDPVTYTDGEIVGSLTWTAGPHTATTTLKLAGTIESPDEWWRLTHPGELSAG